MKICYNIVRFPLLKGSTKEGIKMKSDDLAEQYHSLEKLASEYTVIDEFVRTEDGSQVTDRALINEVRFANLWANASIAKDKKPFNSRSKQTYEYFMKKVEEQLSQNGDWDITGLKLGTSLLIPKSLYPREILNNLFYDEISTRIVEEYIKQHFEVKNSLSTIWKKKRKNFRLQGMAKNFHFADLKDYYEKYTVKEGVYTNETNGKVIVDDVKKIRIAFAMLWHKAAKTRTLSADRDYYAYCADAADTYDAIKDTIGEAVRYDGTFDLYHLRKSMNRTIEAYPDAEMILKRLFQTEMDAQITYDFFSTLNLDMKDVRNLLPTSSTLEQIHKPKVIA